MLESYIPPAFLEQEEVLQSDLTHQQYFSLQQPHHPQESGPIAKSRCIRYTGIGTRYAGAQILKRYAHIY